MADDDFESFDNLDDLDWSDVEEELKQNREQILNAAAEAQEVDLTDVASGDSGGGGGGMDDDPDTNLDINFLLDVQLKISVEVGRSKIYIHELLEYNQGQIIELESMLGQHLDIRVNEKLVARGEIVVINDKFGVRITQIVSPESRIGVLQ